MEDVQGQAFILRLPDELLDKIIGEASSIPENTPWRFGYWYGRQQLFQMRESLCLVCRRFYPIAMPYLYLEALVPYDRHSEQINPVKLLHRSCRRNPLLWPLCRVLTIYFRETDKVQDPLLYLATDLISWFSEIKCLVLFSVGRWERLWEMVHLALQNCPDLSHLSLLLANPTYEIDLPRVVEIFSDPKSHRIRTLELEGVSTRGDALAWRKLQSIPGTAKFTTITLRSFLQTPEVLGDLVRWPAMLEEFNLEHTFGRCYGVSGLYTGWSLATLQPILVIHKATLRVIRIRCIDEGGLAGFDMRDFEKLEELSLSAQTTRAAWRQNAPEIPFIARLCAPRLRTFHWDLTLEDQQGEETLMDFGEPEEDFLRAFVCAALKARSPLREIEITFTPPDWSSQNDGVYPWDRMDALGREFEGDGIRLCYNPPSISRERFFEINREMSPFQKESKGDPA